ncbi:MAG: FmdB family zinc ribbon protein [Dehalococcoidia bacterium]
MATEEYQCVDCGHRFPSASPMADERCPRCGGARLERNPWLLGTAEADGLTAEDYRERVEVTT